jgi:SAM-dependent methyltransferase
MNAIEVERLGGVEEKYWWHRGRQRIVQRVLSRYVPKGARILDLGCGPGGTTLAFSAFGEVIAADASLASVRRARARGLQVARMDATSIAIRSASCDAAVALDLLEHLPDDAMAVAEMYRVLRPGGHFIATVPAYQFLWSEHDDAVGHVRRYTKRPLERLLAEAGFETRLCTYTMSSILPAAIAMRLLERVKPRRPEPVANFVRVPGMVNAALERVVGFGPTPIAGLPMPFGLSLIAVAQKPACEDDTSARRRQSPAW